MQQIMAFETDLLEYEDLFDENPAVERKVAALKDGARAELALIDSMGGAC
jgi:(2R)-ethylmalonyl-CoA mutase